MFKLGSGRLTWTGEERRSDRYGSIFLVERGHSFSKDVIAKLNIPKDLVNTQGRLFAVVTETRDSTHIGDLFHGVYPRTPERGATIILGSGLLFFEELTRPLLDLEYDGSSCSSSFTTVGLKPTDGRKTLWLDIRQLYNAHEQTVDLFFVSDLKT